MRGSVRAAPSASPPPRHVQQVLLGLTQSKVHATETHAHPKGHLLTGSPPHPEVCSDVGASWAGERPNDHAAAAAAADPRRFPAAVVANFATFGSTCEIIYARRR